MNSHNDSCMDSLPDSGMWTSFICNGKDPESSPNESPKSQQLTFNNHRSLLLTKMRDLRRTVDMLSQRSLFDKCIPEFNQLFWENIADDIKRLEAKVQSPSQFYSFLMVSTFQPKIMHKI